LEEAIILRSMDRIYAGLPQRKCVSGIMYLRERKQQGRCSPNLSELTPMEIATSGPYAICSHGLTSALEAGSSEASAEGQHIEGLKGEILNASVFSFMPFAPTRSSLLFTVSLPTPYAGGFVCSITPGRHF